MADFEIQQVLRNDPDNGAARLQDRIGHDAHQPDVPATVNESSSLLREKRAQLQCRVAVREVRAATGATKHADALMHGRVRQRSDTDEEFAPTGFEAAIRSIKRS